MNRKKTICHVTCQHAAEDIRVFHKECKSLAQMGYKVFLIQQGDSYVKDNIEIVGYGERHKIRYLKTFLDVIRVSKIVSRIDADLFHIHEPVLLPIAFKLKRKGKYVIFDSHEYYRDQIKIRHYLNKPMRELISILYSKFEKIVLKKIDAVIFPCLKNNEHPFQDYCVRAITLNNVPKLSELYFRYDANKEKEQNSICYIGTLSRERGVTNAIKAVGMLDYKLYLAGRFSTDKYMSEVFDMPEFKNVEYLGIIDRENVVALIQKSKIGLATLLNVGQYNQYDNLPTKAYEYMSMGIPVILSKSCFNDFIINKYKFGLSVNPDEPDKISEAIYNIIHNEELYKEMSINARKAIKEHFNWEKESKKLYALYKDIFSGTFT